MKKSTLFLSELSFVMIFTVMFALTASAQKSKEGKELNITKIELGYPCPAIPYYHVKAELDLPQPSIIEVEVAVDGKVLRATDLKRADGNENLTGHLLRAILKCKTDAEARQVGIEWATMQSRDLIKEGVPGIHYYTLERSDNIARIVKSSS